MSTEQVRYWEWSFDGRFYFDADTGIYFDTHSGTFGNVYMDQANQQQPGWNLETGLGILESVTGGLPRRTQYQEAYTQLANPREKLFEESQKQHPFPVFIACRDKETARDLIEFTAAQVQSPVSIITGNEHNWQYPVAPERDAIVFPVYRNEAENMILALAGMVHKKDRHLPDQFLLVDDLACVHKLDFSARQNLQWLFVNGPRHHVYPIATYTPDDESNALTWIDGFSAAHRIDVT